MRLDASFFSGATVDVAQRLLGKLLVRQLDGRRLSGIIVEVEAYLSENDPASHSHRGPTRRNAAMFQPAGTLYVYTIHARFCLNIVTEQAGAGAAVLVRALEPWEGIDIMQAHRGTGIWRLLCSGPARLCQALAIDTQLDGTDLTRSQDVWLESAPPPVEEIAWQMTASPRIGISSAREVHYRYFIDGHRDVSGLARLHQQPRQWTFGKRS